MILGLEVLVSHLDELFEEFLTTLLFHVTVRLRRSQVIHQSPTRFPEKLKTKYPLQRFDSRL